MALDAQGDSRSGSQASAVRGRRPRLESGAEKAGALVDTHDPKSRSGNTGPIHVPASLPSLTGHTELGRPRHLADREGVLIKGDQMSQKELFGACVAALILACAAGWTISDTQARAASPATVQIDPFTMMTGAKQVPTEHFVDYSVVFN